MNTPTVFKEKDVGSALKEFGRDFMLSLSGEGNKELNLSYLTVELRRMRVGMSDYIIRVATQGKDGSDGTSVSIRGNRGLTKYETVKRLAEVICREMEERGDTTHSWKDTDTDHLADLLAGSLKFFSVSLNVGEMKFTTEALM